MSETQIYFWIIIGLLGLGGLIPMAAAALLSRSNRRKDESLWLATASGLRDTAEQQKLGFPTTWSLWFALLGSGVVTFYALKILTGGEAASSTLFTTEGYVYNLSTFELSIYVDRLAAFFLLLIGGLSVGIAIYSFA